MSNTKRVLLLIPALLTVIIAFIGFAIACVCWFVGMALDMSGDRLMAGALYLAKWINAVYWDKQP